MPTKRTRTASKKPRYTAKTADRHVLYQLSVQDAETEARFLDRVFRKITGRVPASLREDFCGTALLCAEWAKKRDRTAVGIDLDKSVLAWGTEHNLKPIGEPGNRVRLLRQNVLARVPGHFDITVALNFSYFIFQSRDLLREYFASVHRSVAKGGLFVLDAYGGYESWKPVEEPRRLSGFTYVWDQAEVYPIENRVVNHIHFEFPNGSKMKQAFTYDWRLWTLPEITEVLAEAGFSRSAVYWESADAKGEGTGVFRRKTGVAQEAAWIVYIIAER
ncbi:MAG TPA: class I SAM-dependent methyltransferase [Polyangiaceae bacterium]|jgi:SAM-dependent methyltransferase|nr:class I SAM-dependent methyltransferase [Polyangiaceae bacterium]